jgi:hypothetical protein
MYFIKILKRLLTTLSLIVILYSKGTHIRINSHIRTNDVQYRVGKNMINRELRH